MTQKLENRGDTIVEVLIAILVISIILAGAFVSARRSQNGIRQSQERAEATNVAEGQLEQLKQLAPADGSGLYDSAAGLPFCVLSDKKTLLSSTPPTLETDDFSEYGGCHFAPSGGVNYYVSATRDTWNTFIVRVRWDGINGIGKQETLLALRIDP